MGPTRLAGGLSLCVLAVILTAGLWPFHVSLNQVKWIERGDGLEFRRYGSAVTFGGIRAGSLTNASGTIEIWLEPTRSEGSSTILSFDGSAHPGEPFSLHQKGDALAIRQNNVDRQGVSRTALFYVNRVFQKNKPVVVTVTVDQEQTAVYINGVLSEAFRLLGAWNNLTGRVVLANSPVIDDSWTGRILGLAIYQRELMPSEIAADYASWVAKRRPTASAEKDAAALYLFDEHSGAVAHNKLDPATGLTIPKNYFIVHPRFMRAPWKAYHPTWGYWQDVGVNIAGFVPFGFCVFAYLSLMRVIRHPEIATIVLGSLTSLSIELLQVFLPTRSSDVTDLITNTLGCVIGVIICRSAIGRTWLTKAQATVARAKPCQSEMRNA